MWVKIFGMVYSCRCKDNIKKHEHLGTYKFHEKTDQYLDYAITFILPNKKTCGVFANTHKIKKQVICVF